METSRPMHIALFGTSADPPHRGHCEILRWLATQFDHVAVWASDNPFKTHQTPLGDRAAMLRLMIDDMSIPPGRVTLYEDLSHTRTIFTVQRAGDRWPTGQFTLVVGADLVQQLPRWYQAAELFERVRLLVVPRPGYDLAAQDLQAIRDQGGRVSIADIPKTFDVSSTHFRQTDDPEALPSSVKAYIHQNNLYPCTESSRETQPTP